VIYVTSRDDYEMATVWYRPVWASEDADTSWAFSGVPKFAGTADANFAADDVIRITH
jgi:hypothetical protein